MTKTPKEECEELLSSALPFAKRMLSEHREFYPYGEAMGPDGQIIALGADTGEDHPPSRDVIALLETGFQEGARTGKYKATALVVDMLVVPPGKEAKQDAIAVRLDLRDVSGGLDRVRKHHNHRVSVAINLAPPTLS